MAKQTTPKFMDMTHPAHVKPSTTSKPVIVTNRPMIAADPMIAEAAERAAGAKKSIAVTDDKETLEEKPLTHGGEKVIKPFSTTDKPAKTGAKAKADPVEEKPVKPEDPVADAAIAAVLKPAERTPLPDDEPEETAEDTAGTTQKAETAEEPTEKPMAEESVDDTSAEITITGEDDAAADNAEMLETEGKPAEPTPVPSEKSTAESTVNTTGVLDAATVPDEADDAADKEAANLEAIIAKGTYRVPIGAVKHRRERMVFWICFIVLLLLVTLNVLMDVGILSVPNLPHTTFFSPTTN